MFEKHSTIIIIITIIEFCLAFSRVQITFVYVISILKYGFKRHHFEVEGLGPPIVGLGNQLHLYSVCFKQNYLIFVMQNSSKLG